MSEIKDLVNKLQELLVDEANKKTVDNMFASSKELMSSYRCAIMEVETKFKVLNDWFNLQHERNPIESITSRLKSPESIKEKLESYNASISESVSKNTDIVIVGDNPGSKYQDALKLNKVIWNEEKLLEVLNDLQ